MTNFNHERFHISIRSVRMARVCLEETVFELKKQSKISNSKLSQISRHAIMEMSTRIECIQGLLEKVAWMNICEESPKKIAGIMALAKVESTRCLESIANRCSNLIGWRATLRGTRIENIFRDIKVSASLYHGHTTIHVHRVFHLRRALHADNRLGTATIYQHHI